MFISRQSYEGLQITVLSFKEACKLLLQQGIPYILSERFCQDGQDDLETYFGKQHAIGHRYKIQQYMISNIMTTQLRINFRSDLLGKMCKVLQKNLMKDVINLC